MLVQRQTTERIFLFPSSQSNLEHRKCPTQHPKVLGEARYPSAIQLEICAIARVSLNKGNLRCVYDPNRPYISYVRGRDTGDTRSGEPE